MIQLKNKSEQEVINMVCDLLDWYENNHSKADIIRLLNFQDKLSLLSVNLAHITALSKGTYLRAYFQRKMSFSTKKLTFINDGEKIGTAEQKAFVQLGEPKEEEISKEELSDSLNLTLRQVNKVLSSVQQRISFLKAEWDRMHKLTHDNKQN